MEEDFQTFDDRPFYERERGTLHDEKYKPWTILRYLKYFIALVFFIFSLAVFNFEKKEGHVKPEHKSDTAVVIFETIIPYDKDAEYYSDEEKGSDYVDTKYGKFEIKHVDKKDSTKNK